MLVIFGLPGAGKTYVGKVLRDDFNFTFYDGDANLTAEMKRAMKQKQIFTDDMRDKFFADLIKSVSVLNKKHKRLGVAQTFIKEKYRRKFLKNFPEAKFVLIETEAKLRKNRLSKRKSVNDVTYIRSMVKVFEKPHIKHFVLSNNAEGKGGLKKEINNTLGNFLL